MKVRVLFNPGCGLAVVAVLLFAWLADGVVGGRWTTWNESIRSACNPRTMPELWTLARALTWFGGTTGTTTVTVGLIVVFLARRQYLNAATLGAVLAGVLVLEAVLKPFYALARPPSYFDPPLAGGFSFPSGHALRGVGLFGFLAALTAIYAYRHRRPAWWGAAVLFILPGAGVCWSRVYLGVHWPTDVIAGGLVATAWVTICLIARGRAMSRPGAVPAATRGCDASHDDVGTQG